MQSASSPGWRSRRISASSELCSTVHGVVNSRPNSVVNIGIPSAMLHLSRNVFVKTKETYFFDLQM